MTFSLFKDKATQSRLVVTDGKSAYQVVADVTHRGYLNALQISEIGANRYGKEYRFTTHSFADIIETDQLHIDGVTYTVSEVIANKNIGMVKTKVVSLTKNS